MSLKSKIWIGVFLGSIIGGFIPSLWGGELYSMSGIIFNTLGGVVGAVVAYEKFGDNDSNSSIPTF